MMDNDNPTELVETFCHLVKTAVDDDGKIHPDQQENMIKIVGTLINDLDNERKKETLKTEFINSDFNISHLHKTKKFLSAHSSDLNAIKMTPAKRDHFIAQLTLITKDKPQSPDQIESSKNENLIRLIKMFELPEDLLHSRTLLQANEYKLIAEILKRTDINLSICFKMLKPYFAIRQKFDPSMPPSYLDKFDFYKGDEMIKEKIQQLEETLITCVLRLADKETDESKLKMWLERSIPHFVASYISFSPEDIKSKKDILFQTKMKQNDDIKKLNQLIANAQNASELADEEHKITKK